ncbi:MAG: dihydropteroate synthase [Acidobacteria bacterium]|nr:dihydropteroate synthase [Acidobacteriota bacterium]
MGIVNVTPDSFSDGGRYFDSDRAIEHGLDLARQGADWIDVGGESTRPGAKPVRAEEELRRVLPVVRGLHRRRPSLPISIDTTKTEVAEAAVRAGASIINDVSGLRFDPRIAEVAWRLRTGLVLMHLRGNPQTMQQMPFARSVWRSIRVGLTHSVERALAAGVKRSQLVIDPGLGFGKSRRQNFEILAQLDRLQKLRLPILVGTSRKSFVQAVVSGEGLEPGKRKAGWMLAGRRGALRAPAGGQRPPLLFGDAAAVVASILSGAHIVRVHDVAAMLPAVRIADELLAANRKEGT